MIFKISEFDLLQIRRLAKQEVFDDLLKLFPTDKFQPLGTKKECMILKSEALNLMYKIIEELKKKHLGKETKGDEKLN